VETTSQALISENDADASRLHLAAFARPAALLLSIAGHQVGRVFLLNDREKFLGRSPRACIRLDRATVSQLHARLSEKDGLHYLVDLNSTNGTFVNDEPLKDEAALRPGDIIGLGDVQLAYLAADEPASDDTLALERGAHGLVPLQLLSQTRKNDFNEAIVSEGQEAPSLRTALLRALALRRFLVRRWPLWLPLTLAFAALGHVSAYLYPPPAMAGFEVRLRADSRKNPMGADEGEKTEVVFGDPEKNFKNDELLRTSLQKIGIADPTPEAVRGVQQRLGIESIALHTYRGHYTDTTPERAVAFLQAHVKNYVDTELAKMLKVIRAEADFLANQYKQNEAELRKSELKLLDFRKQHPRFVPEPEPAGAPARVALAGAGGADRGQLDRLTLELQRARERLNSEDAILEKRVETAQPYQGALVEVNRRIGEAKSRGYGEQHPELQNLRKQAADLRRRADNVVSGQTTDIERRSNTQYKVLSDRVAELEIAEKVARSRFADAADAEKRYERMVRELPQLELAYTRLTNEYTTNKELSTKLFQKLKQTELQYDLERTSAAARYDVLSAPSAQNTSLRATLLKRTGLGLLAGATLGLLLAGLLELRRYLRTIL
jgi:uncharacterized protein involved in exopolysaccharide biosynthesis